MNTRNRRRGYDHRRRSHSRSNDHRGYGHSNRRHGRHEVSPFTRVLTTIALWVIVLYAIGAGMIQLSGK